MLHRNIVCDCDGTKTKVIKMFKSVLIGRSNYHQIAKYWHFWLKIRPHWIMLRKKSWISTSHRSNNSQFDSTHPTLSPSHPIRRHYFLPNYYAIFENAFKNNGDFFK